ncbi:hypothetical protein [Flavobacterium granuli]|uniref:GyrI-like small molecule binding domain-containing protein n=1 Tax=Flavobacterium granuli TaxID=280093 RepID=A0ABU1S0E1_9FLAO|nr:hypothetical protein [Flavobacterium granuli]MDR6844484.1 hypothetical protein [Flavobacterium granuli]
MTEENKVIEIPIKVILIGEFKEFHSWVKNVQDCINKLGVNSKLLHLDKKGFATNGYDLKNHKTETPYPVKTYLMVQDPEIQTAVPFKSLSNN